LKKALRSIIRFLLVAFVLGLATVFGIVEHHKGTITFESKKGVGTTFTIHLPLTRSEGDKA